MITTISITNQREKATPECIKAATWSRSQARRSWDATYRPPSCTPSIARTPAWPLPSSVASPWFWWPGAPLFPWWCSISSFRSPSPPSSSLRRPRPGRTRTAGTAGGGSLAGSSDDPRRPTWLLKEGGRGLACLLFGGWETFKAWDMAEEVGGEFKAYPIDELQVGRLSQERFLETPLWMR